MLIGFSHSTHPTHSILKDAVVAYMAEIDDTEHEDVMRTFFRSKVGDVGKLLRKVLDIVKASGKHSGLQANNGLPEANRIVTVTNFVESYLSPSLTVQSYLDCSHDGLPIQGL